MQNWNRPDPLTRDLIHLINARRHDHWDADAAFDRAVKAGGIVEMPVSDMFWGDRYGKLIDPFGHKWSIATHKRDMSIEEMKAAQDEFMKQMPKSA